MPSTDHETVLRQIEESERGGFVGTCHLNTHIRALLDELDDAERRVAALEAGLQPFKRWAAQLDSPPNWVPDPCPLVTSPGDISDFTVGDLRRARALLAAQKEGE